MLFIYMLCISHEYESHINVVVWAIVVMSALGAISLAFGFYILEWFISEATKLNIFFNQKFNY